MMKTKETSTKFGLKQKTIDLINSVFAKHPQIEKVVLYGSRAKGNFKTGSDIDLTMYGDDLTTQMQMDVFDELDELMLPYKIDLSLFAKLNNENLREHIERVGVVFYEKADNTLDRLSASGELLVVNGKLKKGEIIVNTFDKLSASGELLMVNATLKKGWEVKKLGEVCNVIAGQSPEGKFYNSNEKGLPFYQGKKEYGEKYIGAPTTWTTKVTKEAEANDILMSVRAPVGPINFSTQKICIGRGLAAIRAGKLIDKEFLFNFLLKHENEIVGNAGAVFNSINKAQIESIEIPLPPLTEQQRIVATLDKAFAAIAKAKANAEKNLKNAKELFESYLQSVFADKGEGWEEKTLNEISDNLDSKRVPITKNIRNQGSIPYYGASGIVDYVADYIFDENLLCVSEDGANLLARTYPIAFSISGKTWVNNHAHVLRFKNIASQRFVELYLNSIKLDDFVSGMAQPKLNQAMLNKIPIPYPPLKEQQAIVKKLDALSSETKKVEAIYQQKINDLDELKKSILQKAFNGELP